MTSCLEMELLVQADVDGELTPAEAARVGVHLQSCAGCAAVQAELLALRQAVRRDVPYHGASEALRNAVLARLAALPAEAGPRRSWWQRLSAWRFAPLAPFGAGFAMAAAIAFVALLPHRDGLPDALVAGHIRALQPGHLMDVVSTDQHTVKPWFDGRIDFAPPVKDTAAQGFPLVGGRLDYLAGHPVAVLVYERRQHVIDLFVWQDDTRDRATMPTERHGYNMRQWHGGGMTFWAVSDLNEQELAEFVRTWQQL